MAKRIEILELLQPKPGQIKVEAKEGSQRKTIKLEGAMVANVATSNGRVYPADLLRAEAARIQESIDGGDDYVGYFTGLEGEIEHPQHKPTWRANLLETVVKWTKITFNETTQAVDLEGIIANTEKGRDLAELYDMGVAFGVSQRAFVESEYRIIGNAEIEYVTALEIVAYDVVKDPAVTGQNVRIESKGSKGDGTLELTLESLREKHPELYKALTESIRKEELTKIESAKKEAQESAIREALGIKKDANILEAISKIVEDKKAADEAKAAEEAKAVETTINEAAKDLKYDEDLNKQFIESIKAAKPRTAAGAKELIESKKKEYDGIIAKARLEARGYGVKVKGSVFEKETGVPEFAKKSHELSESIDRRGLIENRISDKHLAESRAGMFTLELLENFDREHKPKLIAESKLALEAEQTSDLNLPYLVARTIIREAVPMLVALNIFDVTTTEQAPSKLFFETYAHESGVEANITNESVTFAASAGVLQELDHNNIKRGTVVVTNTAGTTTYTEGTDYVIEYGFGKIFRIAAGAITEMQEVYVDYTYAKVRDGEMAAIQRGKQTLSSMDLPIAADRLATQISSEAVVFARSQLGEDAQARALAGIIRQIQTYIDRRLFSMAEFAVRQVANNSGGTFDISDVPSGSTFDKHLVTLERYIGVAKTKVVNRYFEPNAIVMSVTNAEMASNSERFMNAGQTPGFDLNAAGYAGRLKGLPVFATTELNDGLIMVTHRELVQHRVFKALILKGPFPSYDSNGNLIAADQYYVEEFNGAETPIKEKGSYVLVQA